MKHLFYIVSIIFLAAGCEKIDPFIETDEGKNVLGFYLDGEKVSYRESGSFGPSNVYAKWINSDSLQVSAMLYHSYYKEIIIKIPIADIEAQQVIDPDITLRYTYKKYPFPPDYILDGATQIEESYTDFVSGKLSFRKWDQTAGILSGNFDFECDAPQYDGTVKRLSVTKGNFDVQIEN